jgi:L-amino acid N-acyltransferase YncA
MEAIHHTHDPENNAELWLKFQAARETLRTQTDFFTKYKAPVICHSKASGNSAVYKRPARERKEPPHAGKTANDVTVIKHTPACSVASRSSSHNLYDPSPVITQTVVEKTVEALGSLETTPSQEKPHHNNPGQDLPSDSAFPDSLSLQTALISSPASKPQDPAARLPWPSDKSSTRYPLIISESQTVADQVRTEDKTIKTKWITSSKSASGSTAVAVAGEVESLRRTAALKGKGMLTSYNHQVVMTLADKIHVAGKMGDSDESDEVVLHRSRGKTDAKPSSDQLAVSDIVNFPFLHGRVTEALEPRTVLGNPAHPEEQPQAPKRRVRQIEATPEVKEELKRLQQELRAQIGRGRLKTEDLLESCPETLRKAREGPGTDPTSPIYQRIIQRLDVPRADSIFSFPSDMTRKEKYELQWALYEKDDPAYPAIEDGRVVLTSTPKPKSPTAPDGSPFGELPPRPTPEEIVNSVNWDAINRFEFDDLVRCANWDYSSVTWDAPLEFRKWFYTWLDSTMYICHYADIYHKSFFDGTAHADGEKGMFIPNLECGETFRDENDEVTMRYYPETSDGMRFNFMVQNKRERAGFEIMRKESRNEYLATMRSPPSINPNIPKANIYLRPAEAGDILELLSLYNWYVANATQCVDVSPIAQSAMQQRLDDCKREKMPFIVAVERKSALINGRPRRDKKEKVMGYVLTTDFMGAQTIGRTTAEIEIFVHHTMKGQGIGRCLMDKLLEICDPMYLSHGGYFFDTDLVDRGGYSSGSSRRLARVVVPMCYSEDDTAEYHRVKDWLMRRHKFQEQGLLKGAARKFDKL